MVLEKTFGKHQDTKLRLSVIESLTNFGALAGGPLIGELDDRDKQLAGPLACREALGNSGYRPSVPVLSGLLDDAALGVKARSTLRKITDADLGQNTIAWQQWGERQLSPARREVHSRP